jgi:superfamily I DNA/RNA helicase
MEGDNEYTYILKALMELTFQVGRNLLVDFLVGDYSNKSISKNRLDDLHNFGKLEHWDRGQVFSWIDKLVSNGMIEMVVSDYNRFVKVFSLTIRGRNEILRPTMASRGIAGKVDFGETEICEDDKCLFEKYSDFLEIYNEEQKKAIVSEAKNLLCVAGAGSGKTTVLTKRVEFLVKHRGVNPKDILAITFTRKARLEMMRRLKGLGVAGVNVHTFNSFCENILQEHGDVIYGRPVRVLSYGDKVLAMNMAIASLGLDIDSVVDGYFSAGQKKFKTKTQLTNAFMNDCFAVMDYFKVSGKRDYDFSKDVDVNERLNAERIYKITKYLREHMETQGLRDYSDQIIDAIEFFKRDAESIPKYKHVLVDEYQDVNAMQIELIGLLKPENLFAVGDPRQSIFGWRGSDVSYILNFEKDFGDAEVVHLKKNYRSLPGVVEFMNHSIRDMKLPDLEAHLEGEANVKILDFANEDAERAFILGQLEESDIPLEEVFVLARTNKVLMELSNALKIKGIPHVVRADESNGRSSSEKVKGVVLATVHAIKGLEARRVYVINANEQNFPCRATDHPAVEMVKRDDYDREEEERRLFYVAVSRARHELIITHSKKATYYITDEMRMMTRGVGSRGVGVSEVEVDEDLLGELKSWRSVVASEAGIPAYRVVSNAALEEISEKMPETAEELMRINGIGPEKLMRYGEKILSIVDEFEEESL